MVGLLPLQQDNVLWRDRQSNHRHPSPHPVPVQQVAGGVLYLQHRPTIDVEPVVTEARTGSEAAGVPDRGSPGRVEVVGVAEEQITPDFARDPLGLTVSQYISVLLSTAGIAGVLTGQSYVAAQQIISSVGEESLSWPSIRVRGGREVVGEEPDSDSDNNNDYDNDNNYNNDYDNNDNNDYDNDLGESKTE